MNMNRMIGLAASLVASSVCLAPPEPCDLGDLTGDGKVDGTDLSIVLTEWGTDDSVADISGDGIVNGVDLLLLLIDWENCSVIGSSGGEK